MSESEINNSIWDKISTIDSRVIMTIVLIFAIVPLLRPLVLPVPITEPTREIYNSIEALPAGSIVCVDTSHSVGVWSEITGPSIALWQHLFDQPVKIVFVAFYEDGALIQHQVISDMIDTGNKKYGEDWVQLGFIAGRETAVATFASEISKVVKNDYYGTSIDDLPLMKEVENAGNIDLWCSAAGYVVWVIRQVNAPFGVPIIHIARASGAPTFMPYLESGQIQGMLVSVAGGAEYELLMNRPGISLKTSDAISLVSLFVIALVILGNITHWLQSKEGMD